MTKFTVGSQWLTKGGWRAVVVGIENNLEGEQLVVWHEADDTTWRHAMDGSCDDLDYDNILDKPYTEPRKGTVWVNVWLDETDGEILIYPHETEESRMEDVNGPGSWKLIASFKHDWTENEKL
jgi:hypothetical protein